MKIVPVILAFSLDEFQNQAKKVCSLSNRIGIDIVDGLVAPKVTPSLKQILELLIKNPELKEKKWDFDLMVKDYLPLFDELKKQPDLHINSVVVHQKYWQKNPVTDFDLGVALDLDDQINQKIISQTSLVQIMTVALGSQGGGFQETALTKITNLRTSGFEKQIIIDGGVNKQTLPQILENKGLPDTVSVGSYLTRAFSAEENYKTLQSIVSEHVY